MQLIKDMPTPKTLPEALVEIKRLYIVQDLLKAEVDRLDNLLIGQNRDALYAGLSNKITDVPIMSGQSTPSGIPKQTGEA